MKLTAAPVADATRDIRPGVSTVAYTVYICHGCTGTYTGDAYYAHLEAGPCQWRTP